MQCACSFSSQRSLAPIHSRLNPTTRFTNQYALYADMIFRSFSAPIYGIIHNGSTRAETGFLAPFFDTPRRSQVCSVIVSGRCWYLRGSQLRLLDLADRTQTIQHTRHSVDAERHGGVPDWAVRYARPFRHKVEHVVTILYALRTVNNIQPRTTTTESGMTLSRAHNSI